MTRNIVLAFAAVPLAIASASEVPRDFFLHAHIAPGGSPASFDAPVETHPKSWDLKFGADGIAQSLVGVSFIHDNTLDVKHVKGRVVVPHSAILELVSAIDRAAFFSLPHEVATECLEHTGEGYLKIVMAVVPTKFRSAHFR
jgi:hypothetical protein